MDKATEADVVEVVDSPADGGAPAPKTDGTAGKAPKTDTAKERPSGPAETKDDKKPGDSTVRIRPASAEAGASWSPGSPQGAAPAPSSPSSPPMPGSSAPGTAPLSAPLPGQVDGKARGDAASSPSPSLRLGGKKSSGTASSGRAPRKAHLVLRRIEPWSAMKFSFVVALVCFVVLFVAVAVLYMVLDAVGVFDSVIQIVNQFTVPDGQASETSFDIAPWFEPVRILGYTALIGAVNVVLITALSTLGAVIYNVASDLVGGVEVTFSEAE
ncbi:DUF3566 domain-containing protein [Planomonospora corallina]|uniref:DUF3566 domain-containing protein n=1 Tax=Planomonospora corallina TaxID=1806052 RepID=A0ABV8II83_9ACTN